MKLLKNKLFMKKCENFKLYLSNVLNIKLKEN